MNPGPRKLAWAPAEAIQAQGGLPGGGGGGRGVANGRPEPISLRKGWTVWWFRKGWTVWWFPTKVGMFASIAGLADGNSWP